MKILLPLVFVALCGCASEPTISYRVAKVPNPPTIVIPTLAPATTNQEKAQVISEYVAKLKSALNEAMTALDAYRTK